LSTIVSAVTAPGTTSCADGCDLARISLAGVHLGQTAVVVLAVLTITAEYDIGLIATTLAATPHRWTVFVAKAVTVTAVVLPAGLVGVVGSLVGGRILLPGNGFADKGYPPLSVGDEPTLRAAVGTVLYLMLIALFSFGLATALRHTAAAITTVLALLYLTPILAQLVTNEPWHTRIERYAPTGAGLAVLAIYTGAALAVGAALFITRDV
jgi:ABC-2 type transport system permease protein